MTLTELMKARASVYLVMVYLGEAVCFHTVPHRVAGPLVVQDSRKQMDTMKWNAELSG